MDKLGTVIGFEPHRGVGAGVRPNCPRLVVDPSLVVLLHPAGHVVELLPWRIKEKHVNTRKKNGCEAESPRRQECKKHFICSRHLILGCALALPGQDKLSVTKPELPVLGFGSYPGPPEASETVNAEFLFQHAVFLQFS